MIPVDKGLAWGLAALVLLLGSADATLGLERSAWLVGLACGLGLCLAIARGTSALALGPADVVTLSRSILACLLAALVAQSFAGFVAVPVVVTIAALALALDAVDGIIARRTRTSSPFGARFDGEADAFLILVLSVAVAPGTARGCWPSGQPATPSARRARCCPGCVPRCRHATGARWSVRSRASS